jgi:hypothetical protein
MKQSMMTTTTTAVPAAVVKLMDWIPSRAGWQLNFYIKAASKSLRQAFEKKESFMAKPIIVSDHTDNKRQMSISSATFTSSTTTTTTFTSSDVVGDGVESSTNLNTKSEGAEMMMDSGANAKTVIKIEKLEAPPPPPGSNDGGKRAGHAVTKTHTRRKELPCCLRPPLLLLLPPPPPPHERIITLNVVLAHSTRIVQIPSRVFGSRVVTRMNQSLANNMHVGEVRRRWWWMVRKPPSVRDTRAAVNSQSY